MTSQALWPSLLAVAAILLLSTCAGRLLASALFPRGSGRGLERWGWSVALATLVLSLHVCLAFVFGVRPGWISFLSLTGIGLALAWRLALPRSAPPVPGTRGPAALSWLLGALTTAGVLVYLVWSLEEPLATNDFFAIWGLKGKAMFGDAAIPRHLFDWPEFAFSNPDYPIGLPLLYAGVAFLLGRWEDHAMALLFPFFQAATLMVLIGWLKRRGTSVTVALAAAALIANFGLLYSPWLTGGMAEVPVSFAFLLFGIAFCDVLDRTDTGCLRRLSLAALLAAFTKNEGVFLIGAAIGLLILRSVRRRESPPWRIVTAIAVPGLGTYLLQKLAVGSHPVRALDFGLLRRPGLTSRLAETFREEFIQLVRPAWPAIAALALLVAFARNRAAMRPILALTALLLATYLILPALSPFGPAWLVHWTLTRIIPALAPLLAAGIAVGWSAVPRRETQLSR